jgi:hypothetical protein
MAGGLGEGELLFKRSGGYYFMYRKLKLRDAPLRLSVYFA